MVPDYEAFFESYVEAYNRSLGDTVDTEGIRAHFADCFVGSGPLGSNCGANDESFVEALNQGYAFYKSIGTKRMSVRGLAVTEIEPSHALVRVDYRAEYEKDGNPLMVDFDVSYLLQTVADKTTIFAFIAGDEMGLYREIGLVPDEDPS
jgi:hypothetical protein